MANYEYIARDSKGVKIKGQFDAQSDDQVVAFLKSKNLSPISIVKAGKKKNWSDIQIGADKVNADQVYDFTRQLATMLKAGVPLVGSLSAIREQTESEGLTKIIDSVHADITGGVTLSKALAKHPKVFNNVFVNMVKAGERSGVVDDVLVKLSSFINHDLNIRRDIVKAVRYPGIVLVGVILAGIGAVSFVLPRFTILFKSAKVDLPLPTRLMLGLSNVIGDYGLYILIGTIALVTALVFYVRTDGGRFNLHKISLKLPVVGPLFQKMALARFCHVFRALEMSGVPILDALRISAGTVDNMVISRDVEAAVQKVARGKGIAISLKSSALFPPQVITMIDIGEASGSLDEMLYEVATLYDTEVNELLVKLAALMEPLMTIVMGGMILFLALSMFLPIWSMYETF